MTIELERVRRKTIDIAVSVGARRGCVIGSEEVAEGIVGVGGDDSCGNVRGGSACEKGGDLRRFKSRIPEGGGADFAVEVASGAVVGPMYQASSAVRTSLLEVALVARGPFT